jgi:hypothetical protein
MKNARAADFLRGMTSSAELAPEKKPTAAPQLVPAPVVDNANPKRRKRGPTPERGKHIGGYIDDEELLEKVALLRTRLKVDNTGLIKLAVEALFSQTNTQRTFK